MRNILEQNHRRPYTSKDCLICTLKLYEIFKLEGLLRLFLSDEQKSELNKFRRQ